MFCESKQDSRDGQQGVFYTVTKEWYNTCVFEPLKCTFVMTLCHAPVSSG